MCLQWILQNFVELNSKKFNDKQTTFISTFQIIFPSISKFLWFWRVCPLAYLESVILEPELYFANELSEFDLQSREFAFTMNRHDIVKKLRQFLDFLEAQHLKEVNVW